jgi:hypothetical protein
MDILIKKGDKMTHDPSECIRGLQQLLISDKKKIAFLFGAGTSLAKKNENSKNVPAIGTMTQSIEEDLSKDVLYKIAISKIKEEIGDAYTIETLLSNIESKYQIIGKEKLNGLDKSQFEKLRKEIKDKIRDKVSIHKDNIDMDDCIHADFAEWISKADRKQAIEIFTTNYDYLFELGLEYKNVSYYDGFTGSYQPFFDSGSIENLHFLPNQTKLWKIHGSLGWHYDSKNKKVLRNISDESDILIYPSILKYDESRKQPYVALGDRLTNFLKESDTILITCGYSFGDEHINKRIISALESNSLTHVYILYYDIVQNGMTKKYSLKEDSHLGKIARENNKISVLGCRSAIIGCRYGTWKLKREPSKDDTIQVSLFFDEDAPQPDIMIGGEAKDMEQWTGEGELKLPDFKHFVNFLQGMMFPSNLNLFITEKGQ